MSEPLPDRYPIAPIPRREFLKRAAGTALAWRGMQTSGRARQESNSGLLIRGGLIASEEKQLLADVRIREGKIAQIASDLAPSPGERVLDARGLLLLPGGIDPHVHLPGGADDFTSGSASALAGGITTIGNMTFPASGETLTEAVARVSKLVAEQAIVDVLLHPGLREYSEKVPQELAQLYAAGHTSVKLQTSRPSFDAHSQEFLQLIRRAGEAGALTLIHCEDYPMIASAAEALITQGRNTAQYWPASRPVLAEVVSVQRAIAMGEHTRAPIYIVHLSSARALAACREARSRGQRIYVETRPTYLHLTDEVYSRSEPALYIASPPMRQPADVESLWRGLQEGDVDALGSDHSALTRAEKTDPALNLKTFRPGFSNMEVMLPMLHSEGVAGGKLSLQRFVALTSTNPARLFGLFPRKGTIAVGSDADLAIWNPLERRVVRAADLHSRCDFSPYEGIEVTGWPVLTLRRGEVVYERGHITAKAGSGRLLLRLAQTPGSSQANWHWPKRGWRRRPTKPNCVALT